jgi:pSer/pThr/pTyr-binding forkhead associated (FHA) protein/Mg-chelatase subunit ChlD
MKNFLTFLTLSVLIIITIKSNCQEQNATSDLKQNKTIAIVLDNSGSMRKNDPGFLTKEVVANFLTSVDKNTQITIILFDTEVKMLLPLTLLNNDSIVKEAGQRLEEINYKGQFTNIPGAIERAIYELKVNSITGSEKAVILLTDGYIDTGDQAKDRDKSVWMRNSLTKDAESEKIKIFGIAFTENADYQLIQELAQKTGGDYYRAITPEDIRPVFEKIYKKITTPERNVTSESGLNKPKDNSVGNVQLLIIVGFLIILVIAILAIVKLISNRSSSAQVIVRGNSSPSAGSQDSPGHLPVPAAKFIDKNKISGKTEFIIRKSSTSIGREETNDFVLPEKTVSGHHASLFYRDKCFFIIDNHSSNHTYLNGKELAAGTEVLLRNNDEVKFDTFPFLFILPQPAESTVLRPRQVKEEPHGTGTVLSTRDELKKGKDKASEKKELVAPAAGNIGEEETETVLKQNFCPNHPAIKATELCPVCKKAFCKVCMVKIGGEIMCKSCSGKFLTL